MVATGAITAMLGLAERPRHGAGVGLRSALDVWNGGQGKLVFFFVRHHRRTPCLSGAITTGSVPPYPGTYKRVGKNLVVDIPIPTRWTIRAGLVGSLGWRR